MTLLLLLLLCTRWTKANSTAICIWSFLVFGHLTVFIIKKEKGIPIRYNHLVHLKGGFEIYGRFVPHRFRPLPFRSQSISSRTVSSPIVGHIV